MIFQIIQYSIISFIIIYIIHYLISHLTDNLTTPQVRDLVHSTNDQYETIIKKLEGKITKAKKVGDMSNHSGRHNKTLRTANEEMKDSLKSYLKSLNNETSQAQASTPVHLTNAMKSNPRGDIDFTMSNTTNISTMAHTYETYDGNSDELAYSQY